MSAQILTQEILKELLHYNPDTGVFTWLAGRGGSKAGSAGGAIQGKGYRSIKINYKQYLCHRLAFLYMTDSFPIEQCDHINGIRDDNRWANLREVSNKENHKNKKRPKNNKSGVIGVRWHKDRGKWQAIIKADGKTLYLGCHADWFDAVCARKSAELTHGYHQNHGRPR